MKRNGSTAKGWMGAGVLAVFLLSAALFFIYGVLPDRVAQAIVSKAAVHMPLDKTPKDDGYGYRDVSFVTDDGVTLSGWWVPPVGAKKPVGTVLLSHGFTKNRDQVMERAEFLAQVGYQVLLFDHRGHGMSGPAPVSGGYLEAKDYLAAFRYVQDSRLLRRPLVLFGFSLGAMSALRAALEIPETSAVIADSPLANVNGYVSSRTAGRYFTRMPFFLSRCLSAYDRLTGLSLTEKDLDLIPVVRQLTVPVLYLTGENDDLAHSEDVRRLFAATQSGQRRLVYIQGAGHEQTYSEDPLTYTRMVLKFLKDLQAGFPEQGDIPPGAAQIVPARTPTTTRHLF
jgi:uncharacterized protein